MSFLSKYISYLMVKYYYKSRKRKKNDKEELFYILLQLVNIEFK